MDFSKILVFGDMGNIRDFLRKLKEAGKQFDFAMDMNQLRSLIPLFQPQVILISDSITRSERDEIRSILDRYPGTQLKRARDFR